MPRLALDPADDGEVQSIMTELEKNGSIHQFETDRTEDLYRNLRENVPGPVRIVKGCAGTVNNHPCYPPYLIDPYMHGGEDLTGVMFTRYLKDGKRNTLFMNYGNSPETIEAEIVTSGNTPEIWDTFTGGIREADVLKKDGNRCRIRLELPCNYGIIVVSDL